MKRTDLVIYVGLFCIAAVASHWIGWWVLPLGIVAGLIWGALAEAVK